MTQLGTTTTVRRRIVVNAPIAAGSTPSTLLCAAPATVASVVRTSVTARTPGCRASTPAKAGVSPASVLAACT